MFRARILPSTLLLITVAAASCTEEGGRRPYQPGLNPSQDDPAPATLDEMFDRASEEFEVPAVLLAAISEVETGQEQVAGAGEFEGRDAAHGVMALRGEALELGAGEAGLLPDEVRAEPFANIRAAAALLSMWADDEGIETRGDLFAWVPVIARYSGIEDPEAQDYYVYMEVMREVADQLGVDASTLPIPLTDRFNPQTAPGPDYAAAIWRPSPNYSSRPGGSAGDPSFVIIHTCEGSYSGCWGWLKNSKSGVSAHYVVNKTGSEITQLVREAKKAWHISAKYKCSRNGNVDCSRNGASSNNFTIGIEHAGYAKQASWSDGLLDTSAKLVCDITNDQDIPLDSHHVVGHGQLQPYNRIDPGPNWPWASYLSLAQSYCGGNQQPNPNPDPNPVPGGSCVHSFGGVYESGACSAAYQCCDGAWKVTQGSCGPCTCTEISGQTGCTSQPNPNPNPDPNGVHAGLEQNGSKIPRAGLANGTLQATLGVAVEPYGTVVNVDGKDWVEGKLSWFGGPDDNGIGPNETGAITGEIMRDLNDPVNPTAADLEGRPEDFYYVAMRFDYSPNGKSFWKDVRILVQNPATGDAVVVRPVDWGPNTSTKRIIDLSPQSLVDLNVATDDTVRVAFAAPGTPLGPVDGMAMPPNPNPNPNDPIEIIIDSNNANNGANAKYTASSNWWSAGGPTQYGTGYAWHSTQSVADAASFEFELSEPRTLVVEAWWTSGSNRSRKAPYVIFDANDQILDTVYVDQSTNGGKWVTLGTYDFPAGWNAVDLSVWTTKGYVVIADAVRVRSQ